MSVAVNMAPEPPELDGADLEAAARESLRERIRLSMTVRAPTWHQILFGLGRIEFRVPRAPDSVLDEINRQHTPDSMPVPEDAKETLAGALLANLQQSRPQGVSPRSVTGRKPLPAPRTANDLWHRKVFLMTGGPEALRLLAAAGYLTSSDVATIQDFYPKGLEQECMDAVGAALALTAAAQRNGHDPGLPAWLNDQLFTLIGESRPVAFYASLFAEEPKQQKGGGGGIAGAPKSKLIDQYAPDTISEETSR